jgi:hypothetical protein
MSGSISATTAMYGMMAMTAAGAMVSVLGSAKAGDAAKEQTNATAQETLNQGAYKADAAKAQAEAIRKAGRATQGEAAASLAASGVKLGEGTALEVKKEIAKNSEKDALSALLSGTRASDSADKEAKFLGKAGDNAVTNAEYSAASTILGTGGKIAGGWKSTAK